MQRGSILVLLCLTVAGVHAEAPDPEEARKRVDEQIQGASAAVALVEDEAVARALPDHVVFSARFMMYPVAQLPPAPFKPNNLLFVGAEGDPRLVTDRDALEEFFRAASLPAATDDVARAAALAWLRLAEELAQDGFYRFGTIEEATRVTAEKAGRKAVARAVVEEGGNGEVSVTLTFDEDGRLATAEEDVQLKPGPRPICHATKLLDPDPLVRRIVEQDLLIMGRAAKAYLEYVRATASPELQEAIDRLWERILAGKR